MLDSWYNGSTPLVSGARHSSVLQLDGSYETTSQLQLVPRSWDHANTRSTHTTVWSMLTTNLAPKY